MGKLKGSDPIKQATGRFSEPEIDDNDCGPNWSIETLRWLYSIFPKQYANENTVNEADRELETLLENTCHETDDCDRGWTKAGDTLRHRFDVRSLILRRCYSLHPKPFRKLMQDA